MLQWVSDLNPVALAFLREDSQYCLLQPWSRSLVPVPPDPTFPAASVSPAACSALPLPPSRSPAACGRMRALPQDMNHVSMELLLHPSSPCLPRRGAALPPVSTARPQGVRSESLCSLALLRCCRQGQERRACYLICPSALKCMFFVCLFF